jgi:hypothetical protein
MGILAVEIALSSVCIEHYLFSFFFWIDIVSVLSMVLDVSLFDELLYGIRNGHWTISDVSSSNSASMMNRLSINIKASRVTTRIIKMFKLLRILRIVKLYKSAVRAK